MQGATGCDTGERRPVVFPTTGNEWKHHSTGLSSLSFTIQRCLTSASLDHITVSFQIINPAVEPQDVTLEMRGEGSAEIQKWEKTEVTPDQAQPLVVLVHLAIDAMAMMPVARWRNFLKPQLRIKMPANVHPRWLRL